MHLVLWLLVLACGDAPSSEGGTGDGGTGDGGTGDGGTGDGGTGDGGTGDGGTSGQLDREGFATVLGTWEGTEDLVFVGDDGDGDELCRVSLALRSTDSRKDCGACLWAFDLEVTAVTTVTDLACAAVGWDDPEPLVGTTRAYGYTPDFHGHAPILLVEGEHGWLPESYAWWDEDTGELRYRIDEGYVSY